MLSVAGEYLLEHNPQARLTMFGQELNDEIDVCGLVQTKACEPADALA